MHKDTYVIVPVYNEELVVGSVVSELCQHFANVICIDDGSSDHSVRELRKTNAKVLRHKENKGQGAAFRTGFRYALGKKDAKYLITFDADGQHRVEDALAMLRHLKRNKLEVVLGSRFLGAAPGMTIVRRIVLKTAIRFTHLFTTLPLTDTHNGLRVFGRSFAEKLTFKLNGMAYASEMELAIAKQKVPYQEYPVTILYTDYSKSKGQSSFNGFSIVWDLMTERFKDRYSEG
jgi:glycosyltransferase involved in cell wall biosynthesis